MVKVPSLIDFLKAGMHYGHKMSKWHPKMKPYIFTQRQGVHIIDLTQTVSQLEDAINYVKEAVARGGVILFVGTKDQAQAVVKEQAMRCGMPYITERWIGGLLTNFPVVSKLAKNLKDLKKKQESGELQKYTKKEQLKFVKQIKFLENLAGGIENLGKIPDIIFMVDIKHEKTALAEATKKKVPVIAMCDTNVNPDKVQYIIACNDDAVKSIQTVTSLVADAVLEGKQSGQIPANK